jgi:hypothetical protein
MTHLKINRIRMDGGTQSRAAIDSATVEEYRQHIDDWQRENKDTDLAEEGWPFRDPVIVFYDGKNYWLGDGFHRVTACQRAGRYDVAADIRQGTQRDAMLFSAGANADHGLRRTASDKYRAVTLLLNDPEWAAWSDREIARRCNVSQPFVSSLRKSFVTDNAISDERTYTTKHGTVATMKTANIGSNGSGKQSTDNSEQLTVTPPPSPKPIDLKSYDQVAYEWLKEYTDDNGRNWVSLTENQTWHGSSPCWQAFARQYPDIPKEHLKHAREQLVYEDLAMQRQEEDLLSVVTDTPYVGWNREELINEQGNKEIRWNPPPGESRPVPAPAPLPQSPATDLNNCAPAVFAIIRSLQPETALEMRDICWELSFDKPETKAAWWEIGNLINRWRTKKA